VAGRAGGNWYRVQLVLWGLYWTIRPLRADCVNFSRRPCPWVCPTSLNGRHFHNENTEGTPQESAGINNKNMKPNWGTENLTLYPDVYSVPISTNFLPALTEVFRVYKSLQASASTVLVSWNSIRKFPASTSATSVSFQETTRCSAEEDSHLILFPCSFVSSFSFIFLALKPEMNPLCHPPPPHSSDPKVFLTSQVQISVRKQAIVTEGFRGFPQFSRQMPG
jgi:hypothetical protein